MTELEHITSILNSKDYASLPNSTKKELRMKQQVLIRKLIKAKLKEYIEPILMGYELDSDIRIYNDGEDGIKVDFVEFWSDVDNPPIVEQEEPVEQKAQEEVTIEDKPKEVPTQSKQVDGSFLSHKLDWSPFEYGFTIDQEFHQNIFNIIGKTIEKGESVDCTLLIDHKTYHAHFDCPNVAGSKRIRFLYSGKKHHVGQYLQKLFPTTYQYIKKEKEEYGGRHQVKIPEILQVMLYLHETDIPLQFRMTYKDNK